MRTLALIGFIVPFTACNDTATNVDRSALLLTLTNQVAVPEVAAFAASADALQPALVALESTPNAANLATAQTAWRATRAAWRKLDAVAFGPAFTDGISARIDFAPADDTAIDGDMDQTTSIDSNYVAALPNPQKGFLGIEHLIFSANGADAALQTLVGDGVPARRRTSARAMADELQSSAQQLKTDWSTFAAQLTTAGAGSTLYMYQAEAITQFADGTVTALDLVVGTRLAVPLGRKNNAMPDPSQDPTPASDSAVADMTATLDGVNALWAGSGFSSFVTSSTLVQEANSDQAACEAAVKSIPAPFATAVTSSPTVMNAYSACRTWKALWYSNLAAAVGSNGLVPEIDGD